MYNLDEASHVEYHSHVFQVLRRQKLYTKLEKCELFTRQVIFLGYVVSDEEIQVWEYKVEAIKNCLLPPPTRKFEASMG